MQKGDIVTVTAQSIGTQGEGIARCGDTTLFIPYLLPGERASVMVLKVKDGVGYGKVLDVMTPAEERVRPRCPVFLKCGGCQLQHLRYREQLRFKSRLVKETLLKIGGVAADVLPCEKSDSEYGYRNKLQLPVGREEGRNVVGFFAERSHRIIPTMTCPIHPKWADELIAALLNFMEKCGLDGYDESTGRGHVRHIVVREIKYQYIVTLVVCVRELKGIDYFVHLLESIFPEFSLYLNFNNKPTNVILGEEFALIYGRGSYDGLERGISYEAGPNTFLQVNDAMRGKMYDRICDLAGEGPVLDCYSGGGLLTAMLAKKCGRAVGIEVIPEANACAAALAERNGLKDRMSAVLGTVEEEFGRIAEEEHPRTVVLDPPRAGVDRSVLRQVKALGPEHIILVSCNPATLARDLGFLMGTLAETEKGELIKTKNEVPMYEIECVQPFDMFPQTRHIETLVSLRKIQR